MQKCDCIYCFLLQLSFTAEKNLANIKKIQLIWTECFAIPNPLTSHAVFLFLLYSITFLLSKSVTRDKVQLIWPWPWCSESPGWSPNSYIHPVHVECRCDSCSDVSRVMWSIPTVVWEEKFVGSGCSLAALRGEFWRVWILSFHC